MQLSERIKKIEKSGIRKVFDLATKGKGDFINLSIGQPHFKTPDSLKESAVLAIQKDFNAYMPTQGYLPLQEKIIRKLSFENNIHAKINEIIVTAGTSGGIFLLFSTTLNKGDEVILPDPYFVLYKQILDFLEVKIVLFDTYPDFRLDAQKINNLITEKTKMLILNTPNNPTGVVYSRDELEGVAQVARAHNLLIVSDEIYEVFDYGKKFFSIGGIYDNTVTLNGFSKSHSVTGWRVGYAHGPKKIINAMSKLQMYTFVSAPAPFQKSLAIEKNGLSKKNIEYYKKNKNLLQNKLKGRYEFEIPEGAFYAFIKIPKKNKENFIDKLIKNKLLVVPGKVFSAKDTHFRVSFAVERDVLKEGIEIMLKLI